MDIMAARSTILHVKYNAAQSTAAQDSEIIPKDCENPYASSLLA